MKPGIRLRVASPCTVAWSSMEGTDAVRFCGSCKKSVYNVIELSTAQVEALLAAGACMQFYQRADGTVITGDCPEGQRRRHKRRALAAAFAAGSALAAGAAGAPAASSENKRESPIEHSTVIMGEATAVPVEVDEELTRIEEADDERLMIRGDVAAWPKDSDEEVRARSERIRAAVTGKQ